MRICRARLTNCPGALTKCQNAMWNRRDLRSFLNLLVSAVSLMLAGKEFQAAGPAWLKQRSRRTNAAFDVVGSVGGPQTGSTAGFSDWLHRVNQVLWCTSVDLVHQCTQLIRDFVYLKIAIVWTMLQEQETVWWRLRKPLRRCAQCRLQTHGLVHSSLKLFTNRP